MRTRSQKANSGSPLQSLSAVEKPRRTRAKKDTASQEPVEKASATPATRTRKATSTTKTTTKTTTVASAKKSSPPATTSKATAPKSDATVTVATETAMETPTTKRRKRVVRRREPLTPRPAPQAQVPQLSGEELLQMVVESREERRKHARNVLPDSNNDDNNTSPQKQPTTPRQTKQTDVATKKTPQRSASKPTPQQPSTPAPSAAPTNLATPATASAPANPTTPDTQVAASQPGTPRTTGWGIRSLFSSFLPSVFSPGRSAAASPAMGAQKQTETQTETQKSPMAGPEIATSAPQSQARESVRAQPATPVQHDQILLNQTQVDEIGAGLAPTPTQSRPSTRRATRSQAASKSRRSSFGKSSSSGENVIIRTAIRDVNAEQRALATAWAQQTAQKITADTATLGSKRRQLEQPMKLRDVKDIPARRPWEPTGSFGLLPEFFDDSDSDEEAPGWYLVDQLANEQPALKKRKLSNGPDKTPVANESRHRIFDTGGNSASLYDLHPRPCTVPSPMFENPVTHHQGANVFAEHRTQTAPDATPRAETPARDRDEFMKELRRSGHVPGSGSFCVPESDSDESEDEGLEDQENVQQDSPSSLPWTQSPPPAPTPAHAKLPAQADAVSFTPETQSEPTAVDPVQTQRAKALKHTPAKQSRLREVMLPSPSLKSDAGSSPMVATASPTPFAPAAGASVHVVSDEDDMPNGIPLDFGDQALMDAALALARGASTDKAYGGSEVLYKYDEDDEIISEEDDEDLL